MHHNGSGRGLHDDCGPGGGHHRGHHWVGSVGGRPGHRGVGALDDENEGDDDEAEESQDEERCSSTHDMKVLGEGC